ncbi:TetR/AcrR family transcriptional regulator [Streptomyces sp. NPDC090052]|uniref:TetR/AcrR family transcriptional regulator n=1 Tax=unclassified Streptomyces TaxID=2593676 RepID=UPI0022555F73|nr:TetR family transcriptional regulator C-terminal domain-containing protein [Streptomyces sp. NBC_01306]MCX4727296.1 TetR family transcriptional regulator [Streptomyces sp. NBC_01306]
MGRRYDPDRRERIIDAAIRIAGDQGIAGLSHRSVAAEADVPLGSTTYHFATLDELLIAALRKVSDDPQSAGTGWATALAGPGAGLAERLTALLGGLVAEDRSRVRLEYELYLAALRREALRPVAAEWLDAFVEVVRAHVGGDAATARALVALIDGLLIQLLLTGRAFDPDEVREALLRIIGGRDVPGAGAPGVSG